MPDVFCLLTAVLQLLPQVLKKDSQHVKARGMWDVLRRGTSQVVFSDLTEVVKRSLRCFFIFDYYAVMYTAGPAVPSDFPYCSVSVEIPVGSDSGTCS